MKPITKSELALVDLLILIEQIIKTIFKVKNLELWKSLGEVMICNLIIIEIIVANLVLYFKVEI